jgi:hypothetical protein
MQNTVYIARHTYDSFEVVALDMFGKIVGHRMYRFGRRRREWAIEQARQWADRFYLYFDGTITE